MDPAPAVARQVQRVLKKADLLAERSDPGRVRAYTSGEPVRFERLSQVLLGAPIESLAAFWRGDGALSR